MLFWCCPQVSVSTRYEQRLDEANLRNYGRMVVELASTVPDGLVVFFVSYSYMDYVIARWHEEGVLADLINHKLIFIETQVWAQIDICARVSHPLAQDPGACDASSVWEASMSGCRVVGAQSAVVVKHTRVSFVSVT
jgi:hypothetical protein